MRLKLRELRMRRAAEMGSEVASVAALARALNMARSAVGRINAGKSNMVKASTVVKVMKYYGVKPSDPISALFEFGKWGGACIFCGLDSLYPAGVEAGPCCDEAGDYYEWGGIQTR